MAIAEKTKEQEATEKTEAFDAWLAAPMTRMGMAAIPAGEHQDALKLLLRSAFDAGSNQGAGNILGHLLKSMFDKQDKRDGHG